MGKGKYVQEDGARESEVMPTFRKANRSTTTPLFCDFLDFVHVRDG